MSFDDFATRQQIASLEAQVTQVLHLLKSSSAGNSELMTLDEVADYTKFDRRTVRAWVTKGQYDQQGKRVYLPALKFSDLLRFKRSDVEAFGLGVGVLQPSAVAGQAPTATKTAPAKKTSKKTPVPSEAALKVA